MKRICVGRIGAPHGVRGEVKLWPFTADPLAIASYGALATADGTRTFEVEALRPARDHVVARLKGVLQDLIACRQLLDSALKDG